MIVVCEAQTYMIGVCMSHETIVVEPYGCHRKLVTYHLGIEGLVEVVK